MPAARGGGARSRVRAAAGGLSQPCLSVGLQLRANAGRCRGSGAGGVRAAVAGAAALRRAGVILDVALRDCPERVPERTPPTRGAADGIAGRGPCRSGGARFFVVAGRSADGVRDAGRDAGRAAAADRPAVLPGRAILRAGGRDAGHADQHRAQPPAPRPQAPGRADGDAGAWSPAMIDCGQAEVLIERRLDGEASRQDDAALEGHVATCPACAELLAREAALDAALVARFTGAVPSAAFAAAVRTRIAAERPAPAGWIPDALNAA